VKAVCVALGLVLGPSIAFGQPVQPRITAPMAPSLPFIGLLSTNVAATTDYRYQGVSNSHRQPSGQLNLYLWRPDQWYAGVTINTVNLHAPGGATYEVDAYAGRNVVRGPSKATLEVMYTSFPNRDWDAPTFDFWQAKARLQHQRGPLTLTATTSYVPQASYHSGIAWRAEAQADYQIRPWLSGHAQLGRRWIQRGVDRTYWSVGATAAWRQLTFDVSYSDTDIDFQQCFFSHNCDPAVTATLSYSLPLVAIGAMPRR
jgi:uncharacterized protein (TIGR02001 family)